MTRFSEIPHPLIRDGKSQADRRIKSLDPQSIKIDDRGLADILDFLYQYAVQVYHYDEDLSKGDWRPFFSCGIPFQMAVISKFDSGKLEKEYKALSDALNEYPDFNGVNVLLEKTFDLAFQVHNWHRALESDTSGMGAFVKNSITHHIRFSLYRLFSIANAAKSWGFQWNRSFYEFNSNAVWQLSAADAHKTNDNLSNLRGTTRTRIAFVKSILDDLFLSFVKGVEQIVRVAPGFVSNSLEVSQSHEPHLALLYAFLRLFEKAQAELNNLSQRHLDFFYRKVLQLKEKGVQPDKVHVVFELAKHIDQFLIEKDTSFKGGKDDNKADLFFKTLDEILLGKAQVQNLFSFYQVKETDTKSEAAAPDYMVKGMYVAPVANSADGLGEDFVDENLPTWYTLGSPDSKFPVEGSKPKKYQPHPTAKLGFVLAAQELLLKEGERTITINIEFDVAEDYKAFVDECFGDFNNDYGLSITNDYLVITEDTIKGMKEDGMHPEIASFFEQKINVLLTATELQRLILKRQPADNRDANFPVLDKDILNAHIGNAKAFNLSFSGEEGWVHPPNSPTINFTKDLVSNKLTLSFTELTLSAAEPAITYYNKELMGYAFDTRLPLTKIELDGNVRFPNGALVYDLFRYLNVSDISIDVEVEGLLDVVVQSDQGLLDISKSIFPFGAIPKVNAHFYIGSEELFYKNWKDLNLKIAWENKPADFNEHYGMYKKGGYPESHFTTNIDWLFQNSWVPKQIGVGLFDDPIATIVNDEANFEDKVPTPEALKQYLPQSQNGFIRYTLNEDFKHKDFTIAFARQVQAQALLALNKYVNGALYCAVDTDGNPTGEPLVYPTEFPDSPDPPDHKSYIVELPNEPYTPVIESLSIDYKASVNKSRIEFFHLYPFENTFLKKGQETGLTLFPTFEEEGSLHIGLNQLIPGNTISILFQLAESTANPDLDLAKVEWDYLQNDNQWKRMRPDFEILSDDTMGLLHTGVITFAIPKDATDATTIMPPGLFWLRASVKERVASVAQSIDIVAQGAKLIFDPTEENDLSRLLRVLDAGSVSEPAQNTPSLSSITQPLTSFGGKAKENTADFYLRVSERLRHKGRAITMTDYELLVLHAFPEIYKVKCISHTYGRRGATTDYEISPGFVCVAVIPDVAQLKFANRLQPKATFSKLEEIKEYLSQRISPFVCLQVMNPRYEKIGSCSKVVFKKGKSKAFYEVKLEEDLHQFLSPWAYEGGQKLSFGGKMYASTLLDYIEKRPYIDHVKGFKLINNEDEETDEVTALTARSILYSGEHKVEGIDEDCCTEIKSLSEREGIGYMEVGMWPALEE